MIMPEQGSFTKQAGRMGDVVRNEKGSWVLECVMEEAKHYGQHPICHTHTHTRSRFSVTIIFYQYVFWPFVGITYFLKK